jgi:KRAB domain-containing zinc finger protein
MKCFLQPYQCECCGQSFSCVGNLIKHRKVRPETCGLPIYSNKKITDRVGVKLVDKSTSKIVTKSGETIELNKKENPDESDSMNVTEEIIYESADDGVIDNDDEVLECTEVAPEVVEGSIIEIEYLEPNAIEQEEAVVEYIEEEHLEDQIDFDDIIEKDEYLDEIPEEEDDEEDVVVKEEFEQFEVVYEKPLSETYYDENDDLSPFMEFKDGYYYWYDRFSHTILVF